MSNGFIVPAGKVIKEYLTANGINQKELSIRTGINEKYISSLLNGKSELTNDIAYRLEKILTGIPATYWINLEKTYKDYLATIEDNNIPEKAQLADIATRFKFSEVFRGLNLSLTQQANEMLKILKIETFADFEKNYSALAVDFMEDGGNLESIAVWLNLCEQEIELQNNEIISNSYSEDRLRSVLSKIKNIAYNPRIQTSINSCRKLLNEYGVYLVFYEPITDSRVRGALTSYNDNPTIYLSGRFKTHDHIWFALMHEIGHLLLHYNKKGTIISFDDDDWEENVKEKEANLFACDFFIDKQLYNKFTQANDFSRNSVERFSMNQHVLPGIIVARLQHDGYISFSTLNYLKEQIGT